MASVTGSGHIVVYTVRTVYSQSMSDDIGSATHATQIIDWHFAGRWEGEEMPTGFEHIGQGSQRTAYLHVPTQLVYKVGDESANREEARVMADLRNRGLDHAPATTLWAARVDILGEYETRTAVVMPYLPEDGSVPHDGVTLEGAADFNTDNVHANGGKLWLIDAGGMG